MKFRASNPGLFGNNTGAVLFCCSFLSSFFFVSPFPIALVVFYLYRRRPRKTWNNISIDGTDRNKCIAFRKLVAWKVYDFLSAFSSLFWHQSSVKSLSSSLHLSPPFFFLTCVRAFPLFSFSLFFLVSFFVFFFFSFSCFVF